MASFYCVSEAIANESSEASLSGLSMLQCRQGTGMSDVTRILERIERGEAQAAEELLPLVYDELRRLARTMMAREKPGQTLSATALVHEAYLRLVQRPDHAGTAPASANPEGPAHADQGAAVSSGTGDAGTTRGPGFASRRHFFAAAAEAMRRILVDNARRKGRIKRGGQLVRHSADEHLADANRTPEAELLYVHEALDDLRSAAPQAAELVKLRYFAGCTIPEAAELLGVSPRKANQLWAYARAWLLDRLSD